MPFSAYLSTHLELHQLLRQHPNRLAKKINIRSPLVKKLLKCDSKVSGHDGFPLCVVLVIHAWNPIVAIRVKRGATYSFLHQVILLIDGACFSTIDNLVACLQDQHPDLLVLGSGTGGGSGGPRPAVLPHTKATVAMCSMKVYRPAGGLIEGIGSEPDVTVTPTPEDLRLGRDPVFETRSFWVGVALQSNTE